MDLQAQDFVLCFILYNKLFFIYECPSPSGRADGGKIMTESIQEKPQSFGSITATSAIAALILVLSPQSTIAQDEDDGPIEEIVATGYRASIIAAREAKRMSDAISDSIMSEDIGKSTDENIAEALNRITGITIQGADAVVGGGQTVTVSLSRPQCVFCRHAIAD
jgi:hypothetical protein